MDDTRFQGVKPQTWLNGRRIRPIDYGVWLAVPCSLLQTYANELMRRGVGEGTTRTLTGRTREAIVDSPAQRTQDGGRKMEWKWIEK